MSSETLDALRVRAAKNQSLMREVNERIQHLAVGKESSSIFEELRLARRVELACECLDVTCVEMVTLTVAEYEAIRADSNSFFVLPGHEVSEVEETVRSEEHYVVVSKFAPGDAVAKKLDPRKRKR
jgi:hypothetical protein